MSMGHRILLPAAMCLTLGCGLPLLFQHHDPDPRIATMYDAPPIYAQWWTTAESCAHKRSDMQQFRWFAVASPWLEPYGERPDNLGGKDVGDMLPDSYKGHEIIYIRVGRTLDRTEVMAAMVFEFTPTYPFLFSDRHNPEVFRRILACAGISNAGWTDPWTPNPP
jgi:hypothetical protein